MHREVPAAAIPAEVRAECRAFARMLAEVDASDYILRSYVRLLPTSDISAETRNRLVERALLGVARQGALAARVADGYARFFLPHSLFRRRLVLMLAILESSPTSERPLNSSAEGSILSVGLGLMMTGMASMTCSVVGLVLFGPLHLLSGRGATPPTAAH